MLLKQLLGPIFKQSSATIYYIQDFNVEVYQVNNGNSSLGISTRRGISLANLFRGFSSKPTTNGEIQPQIYNRNPRNLERLRLMKKPTGYVLDVKNVEFWHKLTLTTKKSNVIAKIVHNSGKVVVEASTNEWAIQKHLYSSKDKQAYIILAKVFAQRCLETGIISFACYLQTQEDTKASTFLKVLEEEGLMLSEPDYYNYHNIWLKRREKKPWTVLED